MINRILTKRVLRKKLILLFLGIATIPFLLATAPTLIKFQDAQRQSIIAQERRVASEAAQEIASFIRLQFAWIETIGDFEQHFSGDIASFNVLVEHILFSHSDFFELSVVSKDGRELIRVHRTKVISPTDLRDQSAFEGFLAVQKDRHYIGPIFWENNKPFFVIGEGFFSSQNEFLGAVFAQLDARVMQRVVSNLSVAKELGKASIFDEHGIVIAHQDFSRVARKEDFSKVNIVAEALASSDRRVVAGLFKNEVGEEVIGASEPIRVPFEGLDSTIPLATRWFVVAEIPSYVALASVRDSTLFSLFILLIVLVVAVIAALIFAGKIVRPIELLKQVIQKFRDGNLGYKIPIKTGDEVEELATSFYTMADELYASIKTITENKKIIEAEKLQLERIISGITDAVIVTDTGGKIIVFNKIAEALTGYGMREVIGKNVNDIIAISDSDTRLDLMKQYVPPSGAYKDVLLAKNDLQLLGKEKKEPAYVNIVIGKIENGDQVNIGRIITLHDVSRERLLEQTKIDFVSVAAHQLRTPLAAIKWIFSLFVEDTEGKMPPAQKELAKKGRGATQRMITLVNDLLDVSRIEEGKFNFSFKPIFLEELLKKSIELEESMIQEKKIRLTFEKSNEPFPPTIADEEKISIVFQNLMENALNYTHEGGSIKTSLTYDGTTFTIVIQDSGIGIPKSELEKLFTKFYRGEQATRLQTDGSGLGLFIAKNIIEKHKGTIRVESEENKGTKVTVTLPKMESELSF